MRLFTAILINFLLIGLGQAQAADPSPRVGRLSAVEGTVSFHSPDQQQWSYAPVNYPVSSGLSLWTEPGARAEIQIGSAILRLDSSTEIDVLRLDADTTQIQVEQGTLNYRVLSLQPGETVEIETPHGAVSLVHPGTYRIEAGTQTDPTIVAVLEGDARFIGAHSFLDIEAGEQAAAMGINPVSYTMSPAQPNPFDDWALMRDRRERESETPRYVSSELTGYQDLDQYGAWQQVPEYGAVWIPREVPAGWAPYRLGHWAWVSPWGWTWIDDQPWGFAPFHYGRWAEINGNWGWVPGRIIPGPVYAPALVAFTGSFGRLGVTINPGGLSETIGWVPLAPREVYYAPYRPSARYLRHLNEANFEPGRMAGVTNDYSRVNGTVNNYANRQAITAVPQAAFASAQPVQQASLPASAIEPLRHTHMSTDVNTVRPTAFARAARPAPSVTQTAGIISPATSSVTSGPAAMTDRPSSRDRFRPRDNTVTVPTISNPVTIAPLVAKPNVPSAPSVTTPSLTPSVASTTSPTIAAPHNPPGLTPPAHEKTVDEAVRSFEARHEPDPSKPAQSKPTPTAPAAPNLPQTIPQIAPGPAVQKVESVPIRQHLLANDAAQHPPVVQAMQHPAPSPVITSVATPAEQTKTPRFVRADIAKPVQQEPLHPTPAGWQRGQERPRPEAVATPAKDAPHAHDERNEKDKNTKETNDVKNK